MAAAVAVAAPGKLPLPGSPSHPGTSASPEVAAEVAEVVAAAAVAVAAEPRSCNQAQQQAVRLPFRSQTANIEDRLIRKLHVRNLEEPVLNAEIDVRGDRGSGRP